ncbi:MAG: hypothetical protein Q7T29_05700 [Gallionella sp.]|nr:hypothetical protein [Gallionella sp.]
MKMKSRLFSCILCLVVIDVGREAVAGDNPPVRDGMPCLKEICVGDDVLSLKDIQWENVVGTLNKKLIRNKKPDQPNIDRANSTLRGDKMAISRLASYWEWSWKIGIDNYAMQQLRVVRAFCEPVTFSLRYRSESGYITSLLVEPVPTESLKEHRLVVTMINREYPSGISEVQYEKLANEIKGKYMVVNDRAQSERNSPSAHLGFSPSGAPALTLSIGTPSDLFRDRNDLLKMHPECGGEKLIKMD